jgi:hypothetical protein
MITLQNLIPPEPDICQETELYFRGGEGVALAPDHKTFTVSVGQTLSFDSYFNLFNLEGWLSACALDGLCLEVFGTGRADLCVLLVQPDNATPDLIVQQTSLLSQSTPVCLNLSDLLKHQTKGLLYLSLTATSEDMTLTSARFATPTQITTWPALTLSITTFQREAEVLATLARLKKFLADFPHKEHIRLQVIDNGQSLKLSSGEGLEVYPNRNLGGAGGFARGLLEASEMGASHCLFMDDDAAFHMENIARTYVFLALARDPKTALAGAMINGDKKWSLWENGAWFDGSCRPLHHGVDLRNRDAVIQFQHTMHAPVPRTFYGGWWFFAFPLRDLVHYPFPFFVRGDDVSFSIANDFAIHTLSGVAAFQDGFTEKENAHTLYLDLRSHLAHHLTLSQLERGRIRTAAIAIHFLMRSLLRCHYASAEAQLFAWQDVISGPAVFDDETHMPMRRAEIAALSKEEAWQHGVPRVPPQPLRPLPLPLRKLNTAFGLLILNGHLIPFWSVLAGRRVLGIGQRDQIPATFGASVLTYVDTAEQRSYTLYHSKPRFFRILRKMAELTYRFCRDFDAIKADWRDGYMQMTTQTYWVQKR